MRCRFAGPPALVFALLLPACSGDNDAVLTDAASDAAAAAAAKQMLLARAGDLHAAAVALHAAAPATAWSSQSDPGSVLAMKAAWKQARAGYQGLEGVADLSFPDLDAVIDVRYDDQVALG